MTMVQRDANEKKTRVANLQKDIDQLIARIKSRKVEGERISGNKAEFQRNCDFYAKLAENVDSTADDTDQEYEFQDALESDPSKAEIMIILQSLQQLFITLRFKREDLANA